MSCPGLHCPGCSGGQSLAVLGGAVVALAAAAATVAWVAENIWWIAPVAALCYALSAAASMLLAARVDRQARAWGHAHGIYSRADVIAPPPARPPLAPARVTVKRLGPPRVNLPAVPRVITDRPAPESDADVLPAAVPAAALRAARGRRAAP